MQESLEQFERLQCLGEGTYGIVYKARDRKTGKIVAIKRIRTDQSDYSIPATAIREIAILKELNHPQVINLICIDHTETKLTLVFEYMKYDLKKYMDTFGKPSHQITKIIMHQILTGLAYVHSKRILHRDIKMSNILIDPDNGNGIPRVALADFGLARCLSIPVRSLTNEVVTLWYRSPDLLLGNRNYTASIDMWSVGCVFAELLNGKPLISCMNEQQQLRAIIQMFGSLPEYYHKLSGWNDEIQLLSDQSVGLDISEILPDSTNDEKDLFMQLMQLDPDSRITAKQCLQHKLVNEYRLLTKNQKELEADGIQCYPIKNQRGIIDLTKWNCALKFTLDKESPYYNQTYYIHIDIPSSYPNNPPKMFFTKKIFHPNIDLDSGDICMSLLKEDWTVSVNIEQLLRGVQAIIYSPNDDSPYNCDAGSIDRNNDKLLYKSLVDYCYYCYQ